MAFLQGVPLFEGVGLAIPDSDSGEGGVEIDLKKKNKIGGGREFFVDSADLGGIEAANALVGHRGKIVSVENDHGTSRQGWFDEVFNVVPAVQMEKVEFLLRGEPAGYRGLPKPGSVGAVGWFLGHDDLATLGPECLGEQLDLGGLAGAVDSLEDDKHGK